MSLTIHDMDRMHGDFRRASVKRAISLATALLVMLGLMLLDLTTGPSGMPLSDVWTGLLAGPSGGDRTIATILWQLRMPQTFMGALVGACLGLAGLQMQTILDNPLASPFTLGLAAAAGLGAALALYTGGLGLPPLIAIPAGAFILCMFAASLLFGLAMMRNISSQTLILAGIALLFLFQSLLSLLQFLSSPELNQQIMFWLFGSLMRTTWDALIITAAVTLICTLLIYRDAWALTSLRLGEARARSLGVNVDRLRMKTLILVALLTATATSFVGIIGFVGLVAPHIARMLVGEDQRFLIPLSALCGACMLSAASVLSKSIIPGALFPIGIVTALIGVPFFIWLILGRGRKRA